MAERTKATVLKTVSGATRSWVRIPLLPLSLAAFIGRHAAPLGKAASASGGDLIDRRLEGGQQVGGIP